MSSADLLINFTVPFKSYSGRFSHPSEMRALANLLYARGFRIHEIARAWEVSTRTVWLALVKARGVTKLGKNRSQVKRPLNPDIVLEKKTVGPWWDKKVKTIRFSRQRLRFLRAVLALLLRWISFRRAGGYLDLQAVLEGEEPP